MTSMQSEILYVQFPLYCPICKKINNKTKKYSSPYALLYHTNYHNSQDEIESSITIEEVRNAARFVAKAVEFKMLVLIKQSSRRI